MTLRVALVDYGAGNLTSVRKALRAVGADVFVPATPPELRAADAVVIPGVGHFGATAALDGSWRAAVRGFGGVGARRCSASAWACSGCSMAAARRRMSPGSGCWPVAASASTKSPGKRSLLVASATPGPRDPVRRSEGDLRFETKIPHVGWNEIVPLGLSALLAGVATGAQAYFTHSFAVPVGPDTIASTTHGAVFASAVARGQVCGVQFHPEKSGDVGLAVLANFLRIAEGA